MSILFYVVLKCFGLRVESTMCCILKLQAKINAFSGCNRIILLIVLHLTKCELWAIHSTSSGKIILKFHLEARAVFLISTTSEPIT